MRDYLEELLEEWAEEGETEELPRWAVLTAPSRREARERGEQTPTGDRETHKDTLPVGVADSSPEGGAKGAERGKPLISREAWDSSLRGGAEGAARRMGNARPHGSVKALIGKLRKGAMAAAYRVTTPHPASIDATSPSRGRQGTDVAELDAAVRRDARRYDGGFELY